MTAVLFGVTEEQSVIIGALQRTNSRYRNAIGLLKKAYKQISYQFKKTHHPQVIMSGVSDQFVSQLMIRFEAKICLEKLYALSNEEPKINDAIDFLLKLTEENFVANRYDKVDCILSEVDFNKLNSVLIEGLLRSTFRFQNALPSWRDALSCAKDVFQKRYEATSYMLDGLE